MLLQPTNNFGQNIKIPQELDLFSNFQRGKVHLLFGLKRFGSFF